VNEKLGKLAHNYQESLNLNKNACTDLTDEINT
jgi:hypothetical protein